MSIGPFLCTPIYRSYLWGGRRFAEVLGRSLPEEGPVAESWEVADLEEGASEIETSPLEGVSLHEAIHANRRDMVGRTGDRFPLLVKYLDARAWLSVQVHPDDARSPTGIGKTEMWYVVAAERDAAVYSGLVPGTSREDLEAAVRGGSVESVLNRVHVAAGDALLTPAGRVHAIGPGTLVLEIQQPSNVTFRLHDWGRTGPNGKPRALNVDEALGVIDFSDERAPKLSPVVRREIWGKRKLLAISSRFLVESWDASDTLDVAQPFATRTDGGPDVIACIRGELTISWDGGALAVPPGRTAVVPAGVGEYNVEFAGPCLVVRARVPDLARGLGDWTPASPEEAERIRGVCDGVAAGTLLDQMAAR